MVSTIVTSTTNNLQWGQKSLKIVLQILVIYKSLEARYTGGSHLRYLHFRGLHLLCNQDFGLSDPLPFVITFSTKRNQKLPFSDPPPPSPLPSFVIT